MGQRKVLFLTKYGRAGASSRYRTYAYLSYLRERGWDPTVQPLLPDAYVESLYATGRRRLLEVLKGVACRALSLSRLPLRNFDVIFVQYELIPHLPFLVEREFYRRYGEKIVVDYDDATFAMYQQNALLQNKIAQVMKSARLVLTGNQYLAAYARSYARQVAILPTAIETGRYRPKHDYRGNERRPVVGWIGTPVTARDLASASEAFQHAARKADFTLRCIGAAPGFAIPGVDVEVCAWSEAAEAGAVREFDIGVMPLVENAFTIGKCGFKLIQYMCCGVPAVATRLGANCEIIQDGENGYLASTQAEFSEKLCILLRDAGLREELGRAARATIEQRYSMDVTAPRLCALLNEVAHGQAAGARRAQSPAGEDSACVSY